MPLSKETKSNLSDHFLKITLNGIDDLILVACQPVKY